LSRKKKKKDNKTWLGKNEEKDKKTWLGKNESFNLRETSVYPMFMELWNQFVAI
jgi:hypothetical protein